MSENFKDDENAENHIERLVAVRRVAKTTKGGRTMSFTALVVVGNGNGKMGVGYAKAKEVPVAVNKAVQIAKKSYFEVPRIQGTIPHPVQGEDSAGAVFLRPASPGTGVIAGGPVRAVLECAGYTDVLTKNLGSSNAINMVHATAAALKNLERPEVVALRRGLPIEEVVPAVMRAAAAKVSVNLLDQELANKKVTNKKPTKPRKTAAAQVSEEVAPKVEDAAPAKETPQETPESAESASADKSTNEVEVSKE
jgi:small subunit ribosomal protein S5